MGLTLDAQTIVSISAFIAAVVALYKYFADAVRFMDRQKVQDEEIKAMKKAFDERELKCQERMEQAQANDKEDIDAFRKEVNEELCLVSYGLLACLKGLSEQGCDGPVHEAIDKMEKHLNQKAHGGK